MIKPTLRPDFKVPQKLNLRMIKSMRRTFCTLGTIAWTVALIAAEGDPKADLIRASNKLADAANYTWKTSVEVPGDPTGTIEGRAEKEGTIVLTLARGEQSFEGVLKGDKGAVKGDAAWSSLKEALEVEGNEFRGVKFVARLMQNFKTPPVEIKELAGSLTDWKLSEGTYHEMLSPEITKDLLLYRMRGGQTPEVSEPKGSIKIWTKDGVLSKYEIKLQGTISFNGNEREVSRTHTTEIKDVGTTKVKVPEEAAKKL